MIFDLLAASGSVFDVDTATRAYLDTLHGSAKEQSDTYFEGSYYLLVFSAVITVLIDWLILRFRMATAFRDLGERVFKRAFGVTWITALLYFLVSTVIALPWTIYTGYFREKQYDLLDQTFGVWLWDQSIGFIIGLVIVPLLIALVYLVICKAPKTWWVAGTAVAGVFLFAVTMLAPVFIAPLFNTFTEMEDGPLRDRLVAMASDFNVPAENIYVFDQSRQNKRISANVSGFGPTIRISLNDNLLERTSEEEVLAVMGHELGHYVLNHGAWRVATMLTILGLGLFLVSRVSPWLIARYGERWGVRDIADPASIPVLAIVLGVYLLLATPATNGIIRLQENQADAFGLMAAKEPDGFARAAMRLSEYRKLEPSAVEEFLFYTHPSGENRVRRSMQWKADNVPGAIMEAPPPGYLDQ